MKKTIQLGHRIVRKDQKDIKGGNNFGFLEMLEAVDDTGTCQTTCAGCPGLFRCPAGTMKCSMTEQKEIVCDGKTYSCSNPCTQSPGYY